MNAFTNLPTVHTYHIDIKGQGGPLFAKIDPSLLRRRDWEPDDGLPCERVERIIGIDLSRDHEVSIFDSEGLLCDGSFQFEDKAIKSIPAHENPKVVNTYEPVALRFEINLTSPINLERLNVEPVACDKHGGIFLRALEVDGVIYEPSPHFD